MITFDPQTYTRWKEKDIKTISIEFISSGCEGTSISVHENIILKGYLLSETADTNIAIYIDPKNQETLKDAYLTKVGSNWILKSSAILTRCGCGKSFGIKTGNLKIDNIKILKSKLSKNQSKNH